MNTKITNIFSFYCDESGNSGSNYLDAEQPFYILAGWLIPEKIMNDKNIIKKFQKSDFVGLDLNSKIRSYNKINKIVNKLFELKCMPIAVILEKKYAIAAKVIETLCDPAYNNNVENIFTYDSKLKQNCADSIYNIPMPILKNFILAYLSHDNILMKTSISDISSELNVNGEYKLSEIILNSTKLIDKNLAHEKKSSTIYKYKTMQSLNLPMIVVLYNMLELLGKIMESEIYIIHDEITQYKDGFLDAFNLYAKAEENEYYLSNGTTIVTGFNFLKEVRFENSSNNIWLQISDTLPYIINDSLKRIYKLFSIDKRIIKTFKLLLAFLSGWKGPKICHFMISSRMMELISDYFSNKN